MITTGHDYESAKWINSIGISFISIKMPLKKVKKHVNKTAWVAMILIYWQSQKPVFDPHGRPTITAVVIIIFHMSSVRPNFQNLAKQNEFQVKTMFTTNETVGLAEWIINDTCLVFSLFICYFWGVNVWV